MRKRRVLTWSSGYLAAGLMGMGLLGGPTPALAQTRVIADADVSATGRTQTVVVTQRPLRTFRGQAVRVGRFAEDRRSIGVVRPLRRVPSVFEDRCDTVGTSGVFFDTFPRFEESIGVVRPFRVYRPPVRHKPKTYTNPNADQASASIEQAESDSATALLVPVLSEDISVSAVEIVELPESLREDPWALLNQGYYREARQRFATLGGLDDTSIRTGHALAAALSGDLRGGAALMPADPALPDGTAFEPGTRKRLEQTTRYLYAGDAAMQAKLYALLELSPPNALAAAD
ncbi:MAG: hypothetical protein AAGH99_03265 [Planctomycetota bacterium]